MNEEKYWKCEYENLRRKKKKEVEALTYENEVLRLQSAKFTKKTYRLLLDLGLKHEDIMNYYRGEL